MAKSRRNVKATSARKREPQVRFDDTKYGRTLFSATFDYNELSFARASETLGHGYRKVLTGLAFLALLALVVVLLVDEKPTALVVVTFLVAFALVFAVSRWDRLQQAYARRTVLAPKAGVPTRHVAVCEDSVHLEDATGALGDYDLSELRSVSQNTDCLVASFGNGRYVYVPRAAMSENRFRLLGTFLKGKLA